jgi:hypothetical protein
VQDAYTVKLGWLRAAAADRPVIEMTSAAMTWQPLESPLPPATMTSPDPSRPIASLARDQVNLDL